MTSESSRAIMGGATDVGAVRDENEDSFGLWGPEAGDWDFLIAVADGVGGHAHGKQASEMALSAFFSALTAEGLPPDDSERPRAIAAAIVAANTTVYSAFTGTGTARPGSTFTCALAAGPKCYVGHVGDSRAYMIHAGRIFQVSKDHTWVQLQVDAGAMTAEEAAVSPYRNQVLSVLGAAPAVEPDVVVRAIGPGDVFIVCSDGVTEHVTDVQMLEQAAEAPSAQSLAQTLVALAVAQGGSDNATAVVAGVLWETGGDSAREKPPTAEIPLLRPHPGDAAAPQPPAPAPVTAPLPVPAAEAAPSPPRPRRRVWPWLLAVIALLGGIVFGARLAGVFGPPAKPAPVALPAREAAPQPQVPVATPTAPAAVTKDPAPASVTPAPPHPKPAAPTRPRATRPRR
jgi:PPM family protein phosphatase